ncbi:MAG TPA: hypothetical protein VLJ18_10015 [Thermoanaerobaculia bacterium]|nr:hypothetical protein [Thermoanaerobaculia bacterium]
MTHPASCRRGAVAAGRTAARSLAGILVASILLAPASCRKGRPEGGPDAPAAVPRGDGIFLAEAPAFVPEDVDAELGPMQIARLYVPAATLSRGGAVKPLPPPPSPLKRPLVLTVLGAEGAAASVAGRGEAMGVEWARSLAPILGDARSWGRVEGVHFHLWPSPELAKDLGAALAAARKGLGVPVSVTVPPSAQPEKWKPLAGAASEALVLAFGQRPELGGQLVSDWSEENARAFPLPFRLLVVFGGYGRAGDGTTFAGRILPDGMIDDFSKDHSLDFDFGQVFSSEPGTVCIFKPKAGTRGSSLAGDGGYARFHSLTIAEGVRFLASAGRWSVPNLRGRVFLVEGVPKDGHLVGYPAVRALLTGKPLEARLEVEAVPGESGHGSTEFAVHATNAGPTPTDLSHYNNWIQIRVEGGTVALVKPGDFDRYEQLTSEADGYKPTSSSRAVVARLFENIFAPGEGNLSGAIRVAGAHPRVFLSWHLTLPDGKATSGPEIEAAVTPPPAAAPAPKKRGRRR